MKNVLWKAATRITVILLSLNVYSCGNNNDESPRVDNSPGSFFTGKRISRIYEEIMDLNQWNIWSGDEYEYVGDLLTAVYHYYKGIKGDDGKIVRIKYEKNKVCMTRLESAYIYELDDAGYALSRTANNPTWEKEERKQYSYSNGHLVAVKSDYNGIVTTYEWINNNLVSCTKGGDTFKFTYNSVNNEAGILPLVVEGSSICFTDIFDRYAYYAGILGKPIKNLPQSYSLNNQPSIEIKYSWEIGWGTSEADKSGYTFPVFIVK